VAGLGSPRVGGSRGGRRSTPIVTNEAQQHVRLSAGLPADIASSDAPVVVMRADGTFLYASEGYCGLVGKTREELLGPRADRVDIASSAERTRWIIERASEVGTPFTYRRLYDTPSGDRLVDVSVHRVSEDLLVTTMAYVTDEDDVQNDTELLGSFLDAVPLGVVVYDRALRIVRVNRTVEELGRVRPEHLGQRVTEAFPDVDPAVVGAIEDVLASGEEIVTLALVSSAGRSLLLNFFPIPDAHGAVAEVGCLFSDVTDFVEAHETIDAQEDAIRELATPILALEDGVLVAPLVGAMDTSRAHDLTERLLHAITRARARIVILDVTGVPVIDSAVSHELLNAAAVARLMGARVVMSGISTDHARAISGLGVGTSDIETVSTLADAVAVARSLPV
jgi:anti-anti-sigma regulatory factor/PAS domain-containing protein